MVDTPGHADFGGEVSHNLRAPIYIMVLLCDDDGEFT